MGTWAKQIKEFHQYIAPDGEVYELHTASRKGRWVQQSLGWGMPPIDYITQRGPFQHGATVRDFFLQPRVIQLLLSQEGCDRDEFWELRAALLDSVRPNRGLTAPATGWTLRANQITGAPQTLKLVVHNNLLYGVATGKLLQWDGSNSWIEKAPQLGGESVYSLVDYDDGGGYDIYGGTDTAGRLYQWNGTDAWVVVAAQLNAQIEIHDMIVADEGAGDRIFAGTGNGGRLFRSAGGAWTEVAAQLNAQADIYSLALLGTKIYGGTAPDGRLFEYTLGVANWTQVAPQLGAETVIRSVCVYNGQVFGGTGINGKLYRWNGVNAWVEVAPQLGAETVIWSLVVYQGRLYGSTYPNGKLYRWNDADAWVEVAGKYYDQDYVFHTVVYEDRLFGGPGILGCLFEYIKTGNEGYLPCGTLRRVLSDKSRRDLCVYVQKGPEFDARGKGWEEFSFRELLRFVAYDPVIYDPDLKTKQFTDPFAAGVVAETQTINYEGTWRDYPVLVLSGPLNSPVITNDDTGEVIQLNYNIPTSALAGGVVTIDLRYGHKTVTDDLGTNLIGSIAPNCDFATFHLAPDPEVDDGDNAITLTATNSNGVDSSFRVEYYHRYIAI